MTAAPRPGRDYRLLLGVVGVAVVVGIILLFALQPGPEPTPGPSSSADPQTSAAPATASASVSATPRSEAELLDQAETAAIDWVELVANGDFDAAAQLLDGEAPSAAAWEMLQRYPPSLPDPALTGGSTVVSDQAPFVVDVGEDLRLRQDSPDAEWMIAGAESHLPTEWIASDDPFLKLSTFFHYNAGVDAGPGCVEGGRAHAEVYLEGIAFFSDGSAEALVRQDNAGDVECADEWPSATVTLFVDGGEEYRDLTYEVEHLSDANATLYHVALPAEVTPEMRPFELALDLPSVDEREEPWFEGGSLSYPASGE